MGVKLTEKKVVSAMNPDQTFLIVVDGALRRLSLSDLQKMMGNNIFYPSITLEQSSNPKFALPTPFMADMYQRAMGGYMMKVVNGKAYAAKLDPSTWEFFADGTKVDDASKYETMVHVPDCHFKADNKTLQFGGLFPISGGKTFDSPNWVGAYKMYVDSNGVGHSRPNVAPSHSRTMSAFWDCAQKLGSNFGLANYGFQCLIEALYEVSFGDLNCQSVIGRGFRNASWELCRDIPMGKCISLGDGSGNVLYSNAVVGNQFPVKLFGFEDLWGKLCEFRTGIRFYMDGDTRYAVVYSGNRVSRTADGRKFTIPSSVEGQYITKKTLGTYWDAFPQANGGSNNTYYCASSYHSKSGKIMYAGAQSSLDGNNLFLMGSDINDDYAGSSTGARMAYYGNPTIVSGSELMAM